MTFESSIALGTMVHAAIMVAIITACYKGAMRILKRIEHKQDKLLSNCKQ